MSTLLEKQPPLVRGLLEPSAYPHSCGQIELVETHISWVFLTGTYAYKLKKPVNLGFLDFSSLEKREHFCHEELRLNSRHATDLYLGVVTITGREDEPTVEGDGPVLDYAVKMRQFDQNGLLDRQLAQGRLTQAKIDRLVEVTVHLHEQADSGRDHGTPALVQAPCLQNFEQLESLLPGEERLEAFRRWTEEEFERLTPLMRVRQKRGRVKECHGDLHLGNVTEIDGEIVIFDGIEFNEEFRWTDVFNEIAFLFTDLEHRGRSDLAWRALNLYLELTGDYGGLRLLRYYRLYRIMVRAKVDAFRLNQPGLDEEERRGLERDIEHYFQQAENTLHCPPPNLVLTRGPSGCGKTYLSMGLLQQVGAVRLRSDVERKRKFGLPPGADSHSPVGGGIYTQAATEETFAQLLTLTIGVLEAGYPVIVDATFLAEERIRPFLSMAAEYGYPMVVLDINAPAPILKERLARRSGDASEADQGVLEKQLAHYRPLAAPYALAVDGHHPPEPAELAAQVQRIPAPDSANIG